MSHTPGTHVPEEMVLFADRVVSAKKGRPRLYPDNRTRWRENKRASRKARQAHLKVYHRALTIEWGTPQAFFDGLHAEFGFTLDVAAQPGNAKCARYFTPEDDGLAQSWTGVCWMNPPYGKQIGEWVAKAHASAQQGATVVCLLPARTDTRWWQRYCVPPAHIDFVRGRLTFEGANNPAPFANAVVIFRPPDQMPSRH
jgi:phage N-6-adenine-methyltransferase